MDACEFVACWRREKDTLLSSLTSQASDTYVGAKIAALQLTADQRAIMPEVINAILTDAFYMLLLGLDGAASVGGVQQAYRLLDESGETIAESGDIEAEAWSQFHGPMHGDV